jgi:transposase
MSSQRHDAEFKKDIVKLYKSGERTAPSMANEIGVHVNTIYKWAGELEGNPENAFPGSGNQKPEYDELRRLQRRVKEQDDEIAILKKAAAYFAKNSK